MADKMDESAAVLKVYLSVAILVELMGTWKDLQSVERSVGEMVVIMVEMMVLRLIDRKAEEMVLQLEIIEVSAMVGSRELN